MFKQEKNISNKNLLDIIYLIRDSIDTIISIKVKNKIHQLINSKEESKIYMEEYEELLRQEEAEIRKHISMENQLKIQIEKMQEKIDILEKAQNVSIINLICFFIPF